MNGQLKTGCAVCGRPSQANYRPFCSARCADLDLGRWLTGQYAIPGAPAEDIDADPEEEV